jgi:hypothetical protein
MTVTLTARLVQACTKRPGSARPAPRAAEIARLDHEINDACNRREFGLAYEHLKERRALEAEAER